jgi:hypothetical protein
MMRRSMHETIDLDEPSATPRPGRLGTTRSRGAVSGALLFVLGVWGAVIAFVGPLVDFGFTPDESFDWTAGRFWMELLPGAVAAVCGAVLLLTRNRAVGVLAGYVAAAAGAWFVVGPVLAVEELGSWSAIGEPLGDETRRTVEQLTMFSGLGLAIAFLAASAVGRMSVRSAGDVAEVTMARDDEGLDITRRQEQQAAEPVESTTTRDWVGGGRHEGLDATSTRSSDGVRSRTDR